MKVLLSPAKSIDTTKRIEVPEYTVAAFIDDADKLSSKLKKLSVRKLEHLYHVSKDIAELNHFRFQNWEKPIVLSDNCLPAVTVFTGEVYRGLDVNSWKTEDFIIAQNDIRILSGLYGILKPLDLIYPYRLEMGTKWIVTPKTENLYKYWGSRLSELLNAEMNDDEAVINLASSEYFKAIDQKKLKRKVITPIFKEFRNGEYKMLMTYAKNARGVMAKYIVQNKLTNPEDIKRFNKDRYSFDANLSSENEWVFVR